MAKDDHPFLSGLRIHRVRRPSGAVGVACTTPELRAAKPYGVADAEAIGHAAWLAEQAELSTGGGQSPEQDAHSDRLFRILEDARAHVLALPPWLRTDECNRELAHLLGQPNSPKPAPSGYRRTFKPRGQP